MKKDIEMGKEMLDILLQNNEPNVIIWASGVALDIGYKTDIAEKLLINISNNKELGILGFNAEISLKVRKKI